MEDLSSALSALAARFRRTPKHDDGMSDLDPNSPVSIALGAYRGLLALAEDHGLQRAVWQTPEEFRGELRRLFSRQDIGIFTDAFVQARYGGIAPSNTDIGLIRQTWTSVRDAYPPPRTRPTPDGEVPQERQPARGPLPRWLRMRPDLRPHEESPPPGMGPDDARMM